MKHFFTKASWVLLSPLVNISKEGDIYRTAYRGRVWYIPYPKRWMALWAKDFMKTHVRYEDVLGAGDVVVEVGACTGEYTVAAAEIVGATGHVHTFEVDPIVFQCLQKNIVAAGVDKLITAKHAGASDKAQTIQLEHVPNTIASSTFHGDKSQTTTYEVDTVTLDEYFADHPDRDRLTLLKLTVNGHEPDIIAGATNILKQLKYVTFQSARYDEAIALLKEHGYEVERDTLLYTNMKSVLMRNTARA